MKKSASTATKGMSNEDNKKSIGTKIVKPKIFNLSRYQTTILLRGLKFTLTPKRNNIELKSYKEANDSENFSKNNLLLPHLEIGIEI